MSVLGVKATWKDYVHLWWPGDIFEGLTNTLSCHLNSPLFLLPPQKMVGIHSNHMKILRTKYSSNVQHNDKFISYYNDSVTF